MTVEKAVAERKERVANRRRKGVTNIHYIPDIVPAPRVGKRYTLTTGIGSPVPSYLKDAECKKTYVESDGIVVVFQHTDELIKAIEHVETY